MTLGKAADLKSKARATGLRKAASAWFHKFAIVYRRQLLDRSLTVAARKAL